MKRLLWTGLVVILTTGSWVDDTSYARPHYRMFTACIGDDGCRRWHPDYTFDPGFLVEHPHDLDTAAARSVCQKNMLNYAAVRRPVPAMPGGCCGYIRLVITCA